MNKKAVEIPEGKLFRDLEEQKKMSIYKILYESMLTKNKTEKKVVPVKVVGMKNQENFNEPEIQICAVCQYADTDWVILVPAGYMGFEVDDNMNKNDKFRVYRSYIRNMLGATIDIVVQGIVVDKKIASGSRIDAMQDQIRRNYFKSDANGKSRMERSFAQKKPIDAKVVTVARSQVLVEVFGNILPVFARDVSYRYIENLNDVVKVGDVVKILITRLAIDKENKLIDMGISIKEAKENTTLKNIKNYTIGSEFVGKVSSINNGYFVQIGQFDNGIDVFCKYVACPEIPNRGDKVIVRINILDKEKGKAFGEILRISEPVALVA